MRATFAPDLKTVAWPGLAASFASPACFLAGVWTVRFPGVPSAVDSLLWTLGFFVGLVLLPLGLCMVAIMAMRRDRVRVAKGAAIAVGGMITMALIFAIAPWMMRQRIAGYASLAGQVHRAVSAIHAFEAANGRAPQSLDELVPYHLDRAPKLGKVRYVRADEREPSMFGNRWMLHVNAAFGMGFDSFVYLPNHRYPDSMLGGAPERVGEWAYVRE